MRFEMNLVIFARFSYAVIPYRVRISIVSRGVHCVIGRKTPLMRKHSLSPDRRATGMLINPKNAKNSPGRNVAPVIENHLERPVICCKSRGFLNVTSGDLLRLN